MSKSGVLGALYGFDIPVCHAMGEALLAGAKTVNPKATLIQTAVGVDDHVVELAGGGQLLFGDLQPRGHCLL